MQNTLVRSRNSRVKPASKSNDEPLNFSILGFWGFRICQICGKKPIVNHLSKRRLIKDY
jgi:hypothetical protein